MAAPPRGNTGDCVYFITASTFQKQSLFQSERFSRLFIDTLFHYRLQNKYLLHEFVVMPNHFHLAVLPQSDGDLSRWMHWVLNTHVRRYHLTYDRASIQRMPHKCRAPLRSPMAINVPALLILTLDAGT